MTDRPARNEAIDISPVEDGYVVYDPEGDMVHYLNHTAAMTLELCDGERTVQDITSFLTDAFPGSDEVQSGVLQCLRQLRDLGLVLPASLQAAVPQQSGPVSYPRPSGR